MWYLCVYGTFLAIKLFHFSFLSIKCQFSLGIYLWPSFNATFSPNNLIHAYIFSHYLSVEFKSEFCLPMPKSAPFSQILVSVNDPTAHAGSKIRNLVSYPQAYTQSLSSIGFTSEITQFSPISLIVGMLLDQVFQISSQSYYNNCFTGPPASRFISHQTIFHIAIFKLHICSFLNPV